MPCTAKKDEIRRPQFGDETDLVVTSRELAQMIKAAKLILRTYPKLQEILFIQNILEVELFSVQQEELWKLLFVQHTNLLLEKIWFH